MLKTARLLVTALLACPWSLTARAAEGGRCPQDRVVKIDLDAWAKRARDAKTPAQLDAALAELDLRGVTEEAEADGMAPSCGARTIQRVLVDAFRTQLLDEGAPARVVQVLAAVCDEPWEVQRGVVLVEIGARTYCRVATPFLNHAGSGWGAMLCVPTVFGFEKVTSGRRVVIKVTDNQEWCGTSGSARGSSTSVSWWELQGWELKSLLAVTTAEAYYNSPVPPIKTSETSVRMLGEGFPKQVELVEAVECSDPGDEMGEFAEAEFKACRPERKRSVCTYDGHAFRCVAARR